MLVMGTSTTHHGHHALIPEIDLSTIPARAAGFDAYRVSPTTEEPQLAGDLVGAVRNVCTRSHFNFDDSLVFPGRPNATHLHMYFGNTAADAYLTAENIREIGNSTCRGGTANRSAYWVPAMIDTTDGAVMDMRSANVYYKTGYELGDANDRKNELIQSIPAGFRMIAGDMHRTPSTERPADRDRAQWGRFWVECSSTGVRNDGIPECNSGTLLVVLRFPQCWDGVSLYKSDQSHVKYSRRALNGCPASHPVALPELSYNIIFPIPAGRNTKNWRLSSDNYEGGQGGYSMHGDWINGWDPELPPVWTSEIINQGKSGGSHLIGGGKMIY
jgi:hypothetical protein